MYNLFCARNIGTLLTLVGLAAASTAHAQTFTVNAAPPVVSTGILATPGQSFAFTADGSVNIANADGPYITDANGTITTGPPVGTNAYNFFINQPVSGVAPTPGVKKFLGPAFGANEAAQPGGTYGALYAGFSSTLTPTSYSDFTSGFTLIGTAGSVTAPGTGGYLFFSVNDVGRFLPRTDNDGAFRVTLTPAVPEPGSVALLATSALTGVGFLIRRRKNARIAG